MKNKEDKKTNEEVDEKVVYEKEQPKIQPSTVIVDEVQQK